MTRSDVEHSLRQITWPVPSPDLRHRILSAAAVPRQPITWSDRMWFSRAWRLSAGAAALVIVALEYLAGPPRATVVARPPQALAEARVVDETGRQLGLSSDVAASLARRALSASARPRASEERVAALRELAAEGERR